MGICKFVSSAKLVEYLEQEFLEALNRRGIYDISQFGWLDDDIPDPDYRGLACWQAGALVAASGDNRLRQSGNGFVSYMHSSLQSLGLALVFADGGREHVSLFCEEALGSNCRDVVFKLGLASICLRDFFITLTGTGGGDISKGAGQMDPETFQAPFARAYADLDRDVDEGLLGHFSRIDSLAADIAGKCHLCERFSRDLGGLAMPFAFVCPESGDEADFETTVEVMIHDLCDWYELLIESGNSIFMLMGDMNRLVPGRAGIAVADL